MYNIPEIKFEEISGREGNLGLITLNRAAVLNALNHPMFIALDSQLAEWENAAHIKAVVIRAAEGRAFSAGGDIRYAYERKKLNDPTLPNFFRDEYRMNRRIHHYAKPYIALMDGITMGGGVGISIHGSHRVATDKLIFAMPETGIGFYPDVGTTYYLSRLPYQLGYYLALVGARIYLDDCVSLGLVDAAVEASSFPEIIFALADTEFSDNARMTVSDILQKFTIPTGASKLLEHRDEIANCFDKHTIEEILAALKAYPSEWCHEIAEILESKSPTSLKVTLHALQKASSMDFDDCMRMEYGMTCAFVTNHDFFEGIRALVIDKDQKPKWQPATLADVDRMIIKKYFEHEKTELT